LFQSTCSTLIAILSLAILGPVLVIHGSGGGYDQGELMELIGANDAVIAGLSSPQRKLVERFIDDMNPVSLRSEGVAFDNKTELPGERIAAITAPTLVFHATDDTLQLYHNAEFAVSTIPDARLVPFERGGHIAMIVEQPIISATAQEHINNHARGFSP
jgi:pimeloyl-ACP methyl ester carboxylesterase